MKFKDLFEAKETSFENKLEYSLSFIGDGLEASVKKVSDGVYTITNSSKYGGQKALIKAIKATKNNKRFDSVDIEGDKVTVVLSKKMIQQVKTNKISG